MARPNLPATTKKLQGTIRKDREREGVEFDQISVCPKPELWLDTKAKKNFVNICQMLIDKGLLTTANVCHVLIMAQELSTYEEACREIKKSGMTQIIATKNGDYEQVSPWVAVRNTAQKNYRDYAALFGLDPVSAGKVGGLKKSDEDPFDAMQKKYDK